MNDPTDVSNVTYDGAGAAEADMAGKLGYTVRTQLLAYNQPFDFACTLVCIDARSEPRGSLYVNFYSFLR